MCLDACFGHPAAFFRAAAAGIRALLAMSHFVLRALGAASFANFRAQATEIGGESRVATHERSGRPADFGAVTVEPNALGHHAHVVFLQAGRGALFALLCTLNTRFNAGGVLVVSHRAFSQVRVHGFGTPLCRAACRYRNSDDERVFEFRRKLCAWTGD